MKLYKIGIVIVTLMMGVSFSVQAGNINYSYVDLTYNSASGAGSSGSGIGAALSIGLGDSFYIAANYDSADFSPSVSETNFGVGFHQSSSETADLYGEILYRTTDIGAADPTGYAFMFGSRIASGKNEFDVGIGYGSLSSGATTFSGVIFDLGYVYNFNDNFGLVANYHSDDNSFGWNIFRLGARLNF